MCLAVPGRVVSIIDDDGQDLRRGKIDFGGVTKEACLAYTPEAAVGDYVLVHVGFALSVIDEGEAHKIFEALSQLQMLEEIGPQVASEEQAIGHQQSAVSSQRTDRD
ncbi:MAG TPA: HypC/HybG/HupF family hydrogenase formation chaperone [Terriglobia bacterium]|nr:HypC/HybG/HupF family hydrogenase formation chaperone [Terriglobia bacterium]